MNWRPWTYGASLAVGAALLIFAVIYMLVVAFADAAEANRWAAQWEANEIACVDDPSCDLARFERAMEMEKNHAPNPAILHLFMAWLAMFLASMFMWVPFSSWRERRPLCPRRHWGVH